jgi:hypothetical protein
MFHVLFAIVITWTDLFAKVSPHGVEYSEKLKQLAGTRVILRGYSVTNPPVEGGILLTHFPYSESHEIEETDVPWDAVGVIWRKRLHLPPVPRRPTVEGTLRLGNRTHSGQTVLLTLEDAVPVVEASP